jgi:4-aminobutyrate aminotransferase-like enzyme
MEAVKRLGGTGWGLAGFICESILSCGGQIVLPEGYLKAAYAAVRAAGGLCIADEVQVGMGRVGSHFWGFELQGVIPDIVTIGKPIGNGHPLAAVVTTRKVADAFANGMEYFNTFGGNPVSSIIGREVLRIVKDEGLQQHALEVGEQLRAGLLDLQSRHPIIGDVRGPGLFQGFELVADPEKRSPAAAQASYLANRMREHAILMSTDGPDYNVLKIKPPMCITRSNIDFLISSLDKVLQEDFMKN